MGLCNRSKERICVKWERKDIFVDKRREKRCNGLKLELRLQLRQRLEKG